MRILLSAPQDGHTQVYLTRAFEQLGHIVDPFDYRAIADAKGIAMMNQEYIQRAKSSDLSLVLKGELIQPYSLMKFHPTVLWCFDVWYAYQEWLHQLALSADLFLIPGQNIVAEYRRGGVRAEYMSEAADPLYHHPVRILNDEQKRFGSLVSFVGTVVDPSDPDLERDEWLKDVGTKFPLRIWGSFPGPLSAQWHSGKRANGDEEHNYVVSASAILLDKTRRPEAQGGISARIYRTLAARGFMLVREIAGLSEQFVPQKHLDAFVTTQECLDKIKYYLEHPQLRYEIADEGYQEILKRHLWRHRVESILKLV